jgi:hypothetical protein
MKKILLAAVGLSAALLIKTADPATSRSSEFRLDKAVVIPESGRLAPVIPIPHGSLIAPVIPIRPGTRLA